ncbi:hypothetical protein F4810DRAFT_698192 [Camillea tinctor]|nr:hypothetical protein F4810DRAFT_698192 [Camillea tinctor]
MASSYIGLEEDMTPSTIDRSSSWISFLHPRSGRYCVPDLLREKNADIPPKTQIILSFLAFSDEFVSPVDLALLFHVYMLDVCVKSCKSWDCWLKGVDNWLRGVARRLDKNDEKYLFATLRRSLWIFWNRAMMLCSNLDVISSRSRGPLGAIGSY